VPVAAFSAAAEAFDAVAEQFDARFGGWLSVAAQRRAVRAELLQAFPSGARVLEIGGGTGDDAAWLSRRGRDVLLTDASATMVRLASARLERLGGPAAQVLAAENLATLAEERERAGSALFDGAFSNFAALNCVIDLAPVGAALARLVRPGGQLALVVFGTWSPGEWLLECVRGRPKNAFRRLHRGDVSARLSGKPFVVRYHRRRAITAALAPWFRLTATRGVGLFVPPSAAEPWISSYPRVLALLERLDQLVSRPLAPLGDHVLYRFERSSQ
jgi:SAM-dependent methyltransferase